MMEFVTERRNPRSIGIDRRSLPEIIDIFLLEEEAVLEAIRDQRENIARAVEMVVGAFRNGGRLFYVGAGTSGRLGVLDASECPPTFGTDPSMIQGIIAGGYQALHRSVEGAEDHPEDGAAAVRNHCITGRDVVFGIATGARTPFVLGALKEAHRIGAKTIFLCCTPPLEETKGYVDHFIIPIVGPEIITGSTRLKAGTATKLILNMITTISMIKLGKVYDNLMVDVQAWNLKLVDRAKRIICELTGVDYEAAGRFLSMAGGSAKIAIVMIKRGVDRDTAEKLLEEADGSLRRVIEGNGKTL
jgi:N-acetylmuramic acid 6-phosphate etherase